MVNQSITIDEKPRKRSTTPETDSVATTTTSSRYPTRQSSPNSETGLRARLGKDNQEMFGSRKYTALPTNANGGGAGVRKRAGGGMTAWKRWLLVGGGATLVILALGGYHGVGRTGGQENTFEDGSEFPLCRLFQIVSDN